MLPLPENFVFKTHIKKKIELIKLNITQILMKYFCPSGDSGPAGPPGLRGPAGTPGDAGLPGKQSLMSL